MFLRARHRSLAWRPRGGSWAGRTWEVVRQHAAATASFVPSLRCLSVCAYFMRQGQQTHATHYLGWPILFRRSPKILSKATTTHPTSSKADLDGTGPYTCARTVRVGSLERGGINRVGRDHSLQLEEKPTQDAAGAGHNHFAATFTEPLFFGDDFLD